MLAARFAVLRAAVPPESLPVYRPREHLKGLDVELVDRAQGELVRGGGKRGNCWWEGSAGGAGVGEEGEEGTQTSSLSHPRLIPISTLNTQWWLHGDALERGRATHKAVRTEALRLTPSSPTPLTLCKYSGGYTVTLLRGGAPHTRRYAPRLSG